MKCKFCYATFQDMHVIDQLPMNDAFNILDKLKSAGLQKITFAGGEPLLYKRLYEVTRHAKKIGLTTSVITNGSLITDNWLERFQPYLDWVGVSIDSLKQITNELIGRVIPNKNYEGLNYLDLCLRIKEFGYKLKINTVVNSFNWYADMNDFLEEVKPDRWKVFQALRIEGQNDKQFEEIKVSHDQFESFLNTHKDYPMAAEDNEAMTGSYLLIDPQGRLFENSIGQHTYSSPLQNSSVDKCLSEINLNRDMFIKRGGIYEW
jgi:radical S-adenosyl methionine domain-containing protein 2